MFHPDELFAPFFQVNLNICGYRGILRWRLHVLTHERLGGSWLVGGDVPIMTYFLDKRFVAPNIAHQSLGTFSNKLARLGTRKEEQ